jgi:tetratricopeptide (TPR) repeat protein
MTKLSAWLLLGLLALSGAVLAQPGPGGQPGPGEKLLDEGDVPGAIAEFRSALARDPKDQRAVYNLARALSLNRQMDECFKYLAMTVETDPSVAPLLEPDFLAAREDKRWAGFEDGLVSALNAGPGHPYRDVEYAKALWRWRAWDQAGFREVGIAGRKLGFKSSVVETLWRFKFLAQDRHQRELDEMLDRKGWPRIAAVGPEAAMAAYLVIMHGTSVLQRKYLPAIKAVCEAGELPWARYANIYDRACFNENKPQRYGTHTRYNEQTKSEELYPIEDEANVNARRKGLGLEPLEDHLKRLGIAYAPKK